jgi:site-specific recombinase XerD
VDLHLPPREPGDLLWHTAKRTQFVVIGVSRQVGFLHHWRYSKVAKLSQGPPAMLRHACGYALANRGHDTRALQAYLGHKNIQHTVRYTELSPTRFKNFWRE